MEKDRTFKLYFVLGTTGDAPAVKLKQNALCFNIVYHLNGMQSNWKLYLKVILHTRFSFSGLKYF